jgi:hypothetical protein
MYLGNPLLPVKLDEKRLVKKVKLTLEEKNWAFEVPSPKLILMPYFLFNYHYFLEEEKEGRKVVKESKDGLLALNGHTLKINEEIAKLMKKVLKLGTNDAPELEFEEKETMLEKKKEETILSVKTAEYFKIVKESVIISNAKKFLVPFYEFNIEIEKKNYSLTINAMDSPKKDGDLVLKGIDDIPTREKGIAEVTQETLDDLTKPDAWIDYSKGLLKETSKLFSEENKDSKKNIAEKKDIMSGPSFLSSKWVLVLIIILALFIIYLALI